MYVHTGTWPFKCDICNRGFSKLNNMKHHMALHMEGKEVNLSSTKSHFLAQVEAGEDIEEPPSPPMPTSSHLLLTPSSSSSSSPLLTSPHLSDFLLRLGLTNNNLKPEAVPEEELAS